MEETTYHENGCVENPGPEGMQELCLYPNENGGWAYAIFGGRSEPRCFKLEREDPAEENGRVQYWGEWYCDWLGPV